MEKLVTIATFESVTKAAFVKALLEQEGFQAFISDDHLVAMNTFLSTAVGGVKLQVAESKAEAAYNLVEEIRSRDQTDDKKAQTEIEFDCEECGELVSFSGDRRGKVHRRPRLRLWQ